MQTSNLPVFMANKGVIYILLPPEIVKKINVLCHSNRMFVIVFLLCPLQQIKAKKQSKAKLHDQYFRENYLHSL